MGRQSHQSRQTRRAQARRQQRKGHPSGGTGISSSPTSQRSVIIGVAAIVLALLVFAGLVGHSLGYIAASPAPTPTESPGPTIAGIGCDPAMTPAYHVHEHLDMYVAGKQVVLPAQVGFNYMHDCLYWMHTHDATGVIHLEAPKKVNPSLGSFFDIWGQPLSSSGFWKYTVGTGRTMKVFVNERPFSGDPRTIPLRAHTDITLEIGPPFPKPTKHAYGQL